MEEGLRILAEVRARIGCPVLTDVHLPDHCAPVAEAVDVLQIPAFLSRQTDLLLAAGATGRGDQREEGPVPRALGHGERRRQDRLDRQRAHPALRARRVSFGYNTLVADMRSLPIMARTGYPVVMDATHSVQQPGGQGTSSGGQREFAPVMARAAVALGVAAVFIETHEDPDHAPSDGPNMIPLDADAGADRRAHGLRPPGQGASARA